MTPSDWTNLFLGTSLLLTASSAGLLIAWLRARSRATIAEARLEERTALEQRAIAGSPDSELEAMAADVARLSESHRFLVDLLQERRAGQAHIEARSQPGSE